MDNTKPSDLCLKAFDKSIPHLAFGGHFVVAKTPISNLFLEDLPLIIEILDQE
jgi:hypothetical protein